MNGGSICSANNAKKVHTTNIIDEKQKTAEVAGMGTNHNYMTAMPGLNTDMAWRHVACATGTPRNYAGGRNFSQMVEGHQLQRHKHITPTANGASFSSRRMKGKPTILPRKMIKDKVLKLPRDKDYLLETHKHMKVFMPETHMEILESTDKTVVNKQLLKWMQNRTI